MRVSDTELLLDDEAVAALWAADDGVAPAEAGEELSEELVAVTRRIASQYVDALHASASAAFSGRDPSAAAEGIVSAIDALERLADAALDGRPQALLLEIQPEARAFAQDPRLRARHHFLATFRPWLRRYAQELGMDGARIQELVDFDVTHHPLLADLSALRGIGPRRLARLYCAGLYAAQTLALAEPGEVAVVTGFPRRLAGEVVERAQRFVEDLKEPI
jgi:hypothetical protein